MNDYIFAMLIVVAAFVVAIGGTAVTAQMSPRIVTFYKDKPTCDRPVEIHAYRIGALRVSHPIFFWICE
jgi:hypothetical protein